MTFSDIEDMSKEIVRLRALNTELVAAVEAVENHWTDVAHERDHLRAINAELVAVLDSIARGLAPGSRNLDQMHRDMMLCCDIARAALAKARSED